MTQQQAAHPGSPERVATAPQPGAPELPQAQEATRRRSSATAAPKARGFAAAFGSGSGAAWVFRDLASI